MLRRAVNDEQVKPVWRAFQSRECDRCGATRNSFTGTKIEVDHCGMSFCDIVRLWCTQWLQFGPDVFQLGWEGLVADAEWDGDVGGLVLRPDKRAKWEPVMLHWAQFHCNKARYRPLCSKCNLLLRQDRQFRANQQFLEAHADDTDVPAHDTDRRVE